VLSAGLRITKFKMTRLPLSKVAIISITSINWFFYVLINKTSIQITNGHKDKMKIIVGLLTKGLRQIKNTPGVRFGLVMIQKVGSVLPWFVSKMAANNALNTDSQKRRFAPLLLAG